MFGMVAGNSLQSLESKPPDSFEFFLQQQACINGNPHNNGVK